ncbi:MAG TPA: class I SAM-dependent methyltransferase [Myxococcales bacterium]|nr:class I SAM-dependent methyltransferase [Myxococcales bacterium]
MMWIAILLSLLFVADAFRLRARLSALHRLPPTQEPWSMEYRVITAPGVTVDDDTARSAVVWAREHKIAVLDLVPSSMNPSSIMGLAQLVDSRSYRDELFSEGRTVGHALVVERDVVERANISSLEPTNGVEFVEISKALKPYGAGRSDMVVAPTLEETIQPFRFRLAISKEVAGPMATVGIVALPLLLGGMTYAVFQSLLWGSVLWAFYLLQYPIVLGGQSVHCKALWLHTILRPLVELADWLRTIIRPWKKPAVADPVEERRPIYTTLLKEGYDRFFEERRENCPMCLSNELGSKITLPDQYQRKPGEFNLDQCAACSHIFQNPRLSLEGLDFYYRDFYDGLGEETMAGIFGFSAEPYLARAQMLEEFAEPSAWLDVGGGHGHFCLAARKQWPDTRFDCLDFSQSVVEAERRGWVDTGYRGLFPQMAEKLSGQYDVVSMSHYLEHVREPVEEIQAAHQALKPGGHLMIEVPDPASRLGSLLGRYWLPWFQPQHQHFLSAENIRQLFGKHGFEAVLWHRGKAHQKVDFFLASIILLERLGPDPRRPWNPRMGLPGRIRHKLVWGMGLIVIAAAVLADKALAGFLQRPGWSNTYRVLAKRIELESEQGTQN